MIDKKHINSDRKVKFYKKVLDNRNHIGYNIIIKFLGENKIMANEITINALNPTTFELQSYSTADTNLIGEVEIDTSFSSSIDYIEFYIYDQNKNIIFPSIGINTLINYDIREGDVLLDPVNDLESYNYTEGTYNVLYNFFRRRLSSNNFEKYYISEISSEIDQNSMETHLKRADKSKIFACGAIRKPKTLII